MEGTRGCWRRILFCKNSANRSIVCFGRGRWARGFVEIKILDQNLTQLKMIWKIILVIRQTEIHMYKPVLVWILCIRFSQTQVS